MNLIGENLRKIRSFKGFTKTALAAESGVSEATLWKIEKGKVECSTSTLEKLANTLKVEMALFFARDLNFSNESRKESA